MTIFGITLKNPSPAEMGLLTFFAIIIGLTLVGLSHFFELNQTTLLNCYVGLLTGALIRSIGIRLEEGPHACAAFLAIAILLMGISSLVIPS